MPDDIEKRVWDELTSKQRGCDHGSWKGNLFDPEKKSGVCVECGITRVQYDQHERETQPAPNTSFWTWQSQYEKRMGIKSDYEHTPA